MPFFQQNPRRGPYRQGFGPANQGQRRPNFYANSGRPAQPFFTSNQGRQEPPFFSPNGNWQGQPNMYQNNPYQPPGLGALPDHLNTIMGHAGTVTNGLNMVRQLGSFMSLFR